MFRRFAEAGFDGRSCGSSRSRRGRIAILVALVGVLHVLGRPCSTSVKRIKEPSFGTSSRKITERDPDLDRSLASRSARHLGRWLGGGQKLGKLETFSREPAPSSITWCAANLTTGCVGPASRDSKARSVIGRAAVRERSVILVRRSSSIGPGPPGSSTPYVGRFTGRFVNSARIRDFPMHRAQASCLEGQGDQRTIANRVRAHP